MEYLLPSHRHSTIPQNMSNFAAGMQVSKTANTPTTKGVSATFLKRLCCNLTHANPLHRESKKQWQPHHTKIKSSSLNTSTTMKCSLRSPNATAWRKRRPLQRNTLSTNRTQEGSEVCTDENECCTASRSERRLVTVQLQVRTSHSIKCSTFCGSRNASDVETS